MNDKEWVGQPLPKPPPTTGTESVGFPEAWVSGRERQNISIL